MGNIQKAMREVEKSIDKLHKEMFTHFDEVWSSMGEHIFPIERLPKEIAKDLSAKPVERFCFYAKREIDSTGRDVQQAYIEFDGEKRYWQKDGDKEIIFEPYKDGTAGGKGTVKDYFQQIKRRLFPPKN